MEIARVKDIENQIEDHLERMDVETRIKFYKRQKNALNKAIRLFKKHPSAGNFARLEFEMVYFQQTTFAYGRTFEIKRVADEIRDSRIASL